MSETNKTYNLKAKEVLRRTLSGSELHSEASGADSGSTSGVSVPYSLLFFTSTTLVLLASPDSMYKACIWITTALLPLR
jgi:hypothetical protein